MRRHGAIRGLAATVAAGLVVAGVGLATGEGGGYVEVATWTEGFREPAAVVALGDGAIGVADFSADAVTVLERDGTRRWSVDRGLDHPSGLGVDGRGLWVADAGHHRVVLLDLSSGAVRRDIPVAPPLQPTDVAPRTDGALWVSATPQDRLLLLSEDGEVLVDLREVDGQPLQAPRGLAADPSDGVFVAEALGGRILHLDASGVPLPTLGGWGLEQGRFMKPKDLALVGPTEIAVVDSHQAVVQFIDTEGGFEHLVSDADGPLVFEHPLGIAISEGRLFVADAGTHGVRVLERGGKMWNAGRFPSERTLFRSISVRDEDPSPLCRQCHDGTRRLSAGNWDPLAHNHPVTPGEHANIPETVPLTPGGALKCTSCHAIHVPDIEPTDIHEVVDIGVTEPIARDRVREPDFCLECHAEYLDPAPSRHRTAHPVGLPPPRGARVAALEADGAVFDNGKVTCRTCHRPHGAMYDKLLVRPAETAALCLSCHTDHGKESSLHPVLVEVEEEVREKVRAVGGIMGTGGTLTCLSCHDPHFSTAATLLRTQGSGAAACKVCHETEAEPLAKGGHARVGCESCHGMHQPAVLPAGAHVANVGPQSCVDCHTAGKQGPQITLAATHPVGVPVDREVKLPLRKGRIGCDTCHEAHGASGRLLRDESVARTCLECHPEKETVVNTDHDAAVVGVAGWTETCVSCHQAHGTAGPYLMETSDAGVNPASARCLRCHDGSTSATVPGPTTHPTGLLLTSSGLPFRYDGPVPYFGPNGERSSNRETGEIACPTCHDPHVWKHDSKERPGAAEGSEQDSFLRNPDELSRFCTVCHGIDGRAYFRFFHSDRFRREAQEEVIQ